MALTKKWDDFGVSIINAKAKMWYRGLFQWTTTSLAGTIAIPMRMVESVQAKPVGAGSAVSSAADVPLETFSATYTKYFRAPQTGTISAASIIAAAVTSGSTSDSNNYTFGITNVTQTLTPVDSTNAANSNKTTGGTALAADTSFSFTLGAAAAVATAQGDLMKFVATKTGTYTVTSPTLSLTYLTTGTYPEDVRWTDTLNSEGKLLLTGNQIVNLTRSSISPASGGYVFVDVIGIG